MNPTNKSIAIFTPLAMAALIALGSCSSAPKRPPEVFTNRNAAIGQMELGNEAVSKGDFANADLFFAEAWRLATSTDDPETRIRVMLSQANGRFNEGDRATADDLWARAQTEAESAGLKELISTAKIYRARGMLAEGLPKDEVSDAERLARAQQAKATVSSEMGKLKTNDLDLAFAWKVIGLAEKEMANYGGAINAFEKAASIHEKGRYLEDAGYDWYLIASARSKAGAYPQAREALETALSFDRRAENANGLGMDWLALGMIEEKAGNRAAAKTAYERAQGIFASAYLTKSAQDAGRRASALKDE